MALLLPSNVMLESVVCDICYKYLSAIPVKIFPNRKIMCGRCTISSKEDGGTISLYNEVAKRSIFKCINRFDGCEALLTTSEVIQHEENCKSKSYECPICVEEISSYLMIKHFKNNHNNFLLSTPRFVINKIDGICYYFLYKVKNYLVFIKFSADLYHESSINASLNYMVLGDYRVAKLLKSNVIITYGNLVMGHQINCETFPSDGDNGLKVKMKLKNSPVNVTFLLEMPQSVVAIPSLQPNIVSNNCNDLPELIDDTKEVLLNLYFKEREELLPNDKYVSYCFMCNTLTWQEISYRNGYNIEYLIVFVLVSGKYYLLCNFCYKTHQAQKSLKIENLPSNSIINSSLFCKWMCGKHETLRTIQSHEKKCVEQIAQPCPIKSCKYSAKLYDVEQHFKNKHIDFPVPVFGYSGNEGHYSGNEGHYSGQLGQMLSLKPNCNQKIIFVQAHVYITIEFVWELPFWNVYLTCELPNVEPTMIILNEEKSFIAHFKKNGAFRHLENIYYKCYLSRPSERRELPTN